LYNSFRKNSEGEKVNVNDDVVFEMELIKQVEINIDYILGLIAKYHADNQKDKEILVDIQKAIDSSMELRNKKDLINQFIDSLNLETDVENDWKRFVSERKTEELERIIEDENLDAGQAFSFIESSFRDGGIQTTGTAFAKILPPVSRFSPDSARAEVRERVFDKLSAFFNRFFDV
jgi:type I restriction enzyme R subunit